MVDKNKPLHPIKIEDLKREPLEKDNEPPQDADLGVTVAAFVLGSEGYTDTLEIGPSNVNNEKIRKEILKAIQEEGDNF